MNTHEVWQVEAQGVVYEAKIEEIIEWINEGSVLPEDKVRKGNLRWLKADKVPELYSHFNGNHFENNSSVTTSLTEAVRREEVAGGIPKDIERTKSFLSTSTEATKQKIDRNNSDVNKFGNFGFTDFAKAITYPFKFKTSLIFGAVLFMIFMLGQTVSAYGITMYFAAVICLMLANTLVFGCLANTLDNFAQGETSRDFMPGFDEFELWDDVIHPFLLSFGVYIISFGLFLILLFGALRQTSDSENKIEEGKQKIVSTVLPHTENIINSGGQNSQTAQIIEQLKQNNKAQNGNPSNETEIAQLQQNTVTEAANFQKLQQEIQQNLKAQTQTENPLNIENEKGIFDHTVGTVLRLSLVFSVPIFITFLWGIFYFPVACAVAGYTRSFTAAINPLTGFDTIKRLGLDYFKVVGIFMISIALAVGLNAFLQSLLSSVNLPMLGNLPAKAIVSVFAFYLSIVFSVALGIFLSNNSAKLNFRHN